MLWSRTSIGVLLGASLFLAVAVAEEVRSPTDRTLLVGTKQAPPFAIKNPDGTWRGISIELWQSIAEALQFQYEWREFDLQGLLEGVKNGTLDAAVAALTITASREKMMDFTHPFYITGLGIAVVRGKKGNWFGVLRGVFSWQFLHVVVALVLVLCIVGVLVWLSERKHNPQQFGDGIKGLWSGFWWAAVTMTTVGYGDKAPLTVRGRILALIWMFTAIVIITGFTAAFTTALTVNQLESPLQGPEDLVRVRVGTLAESSSAAYLQQRRISHRNFPTLLDGLKAMVGGEIDAVVYDKPLLRYLALTELQGSIEVLPYTFEPQDYGIALPAGSPLREPINRVLLEQTRQSAWKDILFRYLDN